MFTNQTKHSSSFSQESKNSSSFTKLSKNSSSFTNTTKNASSFNNQVEGKYYHLLWSSVIFPWQEALPWQFLGEQQFTNLIKN